MQVSHGSNSQISQGNNNPEKINEANKLLTEFVEAVDWTAINHAGEEVVRSIEKRAEIIASFVRYQLIEIERDLEEQGCTNVEEASALFKRALTDAFTRGVEQDLIPNIPASFRDNTRYDLARYKCLSEKNIRQLHTLLLLFSANIRGNFDQISPGAMKDLFYEIANLVSDFKEVNVETLKQQSGCKFVLA